MTESQLRQDAPSAHRAAFFRSWLQDPFHVGAVAPSSRGLAQLMATDLGPGARVVELGAGTGTLTQAIVERGVRPEDLYLVEKCAEFVDILGRKFPRAIVVPADAATLTSRLGDLAGTVDYVISGLPMAWFKQETKRRILEQAFALLRPEGRYHQFTYLGRPPIGSRLRAKLGITAELLGVWPINLPPAFVYRFQRVT